MGVYSSPEVTGITIHCPGVCGGRSREVDHRSSRVVGRQTDRCVQVGTESQESNHTSGV